MDIIIKRRGDCIEHIIRDKKILTTVLVDRVEVKRRRGGKILKLINNVKRTNDN